MCNYTKPQSVVVNFSKKINILLTIIAAVWMEVVVAEIQVVVNCHMLQWTMCQEPRNIFQYQRCQNIREIDIFLRVPKQNILFNYKDLDLRRIFSLQRFSLHKGFTFLLQCKCLVPNKNRAVTPTEFRVPEGASQFLWVEALF